MHRGQLVEGLTKQQLDVARDAGNVAPDGRSSAARQIVLCMDVIIAAFRTDIALMVAIACVSCLRRQDAL